MTRIYTADCGTPSLPPDCYSSSYTSTLEGDEAVFICQSTFQIWHWSLCKEVNITVVCTKNGYWEPITDLDDMCTELTGIVITEEPLFFFCGRF